MKSKTVYPKVAADIFTVLGTWILGFLGVMVLVQVGKTVVAFINGSEVDTYFNAVFVAANVAMLVIGIMSTYFLPHYVENGVTRKDYFKGALLSSIGLSIVLPIITILVSKVGEFIVSHIDKIVLKQPDINSAVMETDGNIVGNIVQSFIITPHIDPSSNWLLAITALTVNILFFFLVGWFIGASFYRFHVVIGLGSILLGLIIITIKDSLLRLVLDLPLPDRFFTLDFLPSSAAVLILLLLLVLLAWLIRSITKHVSIKI